MTLKTGLQGLEMMWPVTWLPRVERGTGLSGGWRGFSLDHVRLAGAWPSASKYCHKQASMHAPFPRAGIEGVSNSLALIIKSEVYNCLRRSSRLMMPW